MKHKHRCECGVKLLTPEEVGDLVNDIINLYSKHIAKHFKSINAEFATKLDDIRREYYHD